MWSSVKTEGIVLTVDAVREADRRYSILTVNGEKLEVVGRGAQKARAKLAAHLEPFAVVELEIIRGNRSVTVIGVERKEPFNRLTGEYEFRVLAYATLRMVDLATRQEEKDEALYAHVLSWLRFLNSSTTLPPVRASFLYGGFLLRLLKILGYNVQLEDCLSCTTAIMPLSFRWHSERGGLVCSDCATSKSQEWFTARGMDEETVTLLRFARDAQYEDLLRPSLKGEYVGSFLRSVEDLLIFHLPDHTNHLMRGGLSTEAVRETIAWAG